ncbi:MAG: hypothetical protein JNK40_06595 [Chromatiales bacterium]|nr:hypothetical protein [Chromatiales bacterium]
MAVTPIAGDARERDGRVLAACAARAAGESPERLAPIADLGIITCGKPGLLRRSVTSWTRFARHHGREIAITLVDDSPDADRARAQREAARALEGELGVRLRFAAPADRTAIARELAGLAGVDPELADFAVSGCPQPRVGIGGSRNLLNLVTPGRRVLSADDDIIAAFEAPPPHHLALWITAEDVPMHTHFFESVAETEARVPVSQEPDALALHESFVGHSVASIVARLSGPASLRGAGPHLTAAIQERTVRIAATALGLAGDCASDCLGFYSLLSGGDTEQRVLARPAPLAPSREVLRRPEFPILCQGVYFITFCHAVDNGLPLPPYFPVGRGEDQVWQKLLHLSLPDTVVAHLPLAVRHRPDGDRRYSTDDYLDPCARFPGNAFLLGLLGLASPPAAEQGADLRLASVGRHLQHAAGEPARFAALVEGAWRAYLTHHRSLVVQAVASRTGYPAWWHDSMAVIRERLDGALARTADVPLEYATRVGPPAADALRRDVRRFGRLLEAWPALRGAAATLAARVAGDAAWLRP